MSQGLGFVVPFFEGDGSVVVVVLSVLVSKTFRGQPSVMSTPGSLLKKKLTQCAFWYLWLRSDDFTTLCSLRVGSIERASVCISSKHHDISSNSQLCPTTYKVHLFHVFHLDCWSICLALPCAPCVVAIVEAIKGNLDDLTGGVLLVDKLPVSVDELDVAAADQKWWRAETRRPAIACSSQVHQ